MGVVSIEELARESGGIFERQGRRDVAAVARSALLHQRRHRSGRVMPPRRSVVGCVHRGGERSVRLEPSCDRQLTRPLEMSAVSIVRVEGSVTGRQIEGTLSHISQFGEFGRRCQSRLGALAAAEPQRLCRGLAAVGHGGRFGITLVVGGDRGLQGGRVEIRDGTAAGSGRRKQYVQV